MSDLRAERIRILRACLLDALELSASAADAVRHARAIFNALVREEGEDEVEDTTAKYLSEEEAKARHYDAGMERFKQNKRGGDE